MLGRCGVPHFTVTDVFWLQGLIASQRMGVALGSASMRPYDILGCGKGLVTVTESGDDGLVEDVGYGDFCLARKRLGW